MTQPLTVVGISGSLSDQSSSFAALNIALQGAANVGAATQVLDIRTLNLPFYDPISRMCHKPLTISPTRCMPRMA